MESISKSRYKSRQKSSGAERRVTGLSSKYAKLFIAFWFTTSENAERENPRFAWARHSSTESARSIDGTEYSLSLATINLNESQVDRLFAKLYRSQNGSNVLWGRFIVARLKNPNALARTLVEGCASYNPLGVRKSLGCSVATRPPHLIVEERFVHVRSFLDGFQKFLIKRA